MNILCRLGRHLRIRHVDWDGEHYRSVCQRCGSQIVRVRKGVWRAAKESELKPTT